MLVLSAQVKTKDCPPIIVAIATDISIIRIVFIYSFLSSFFPLLKINTPPSARANIVNYTKGLTPPSNRPRPHSERASRAFT